MFWLSKGDITGHHGQKSVPTRNDMLGSLIICTPLYLFWKNYIYDLLYYMLTLHFNTASKAYWPTQKEDQLLSAISILIMQNSLQPLHCDILMNHVRKVVPIPREYSRVVKPDYKSKAATPKPLHYHAAKKYDQDYDDCFRCSTITYT